MLERMGRRRFQAMALVLANVRAVICGLAETYTMIGVLTSEKVSEMRLSISASDVGSSPVSYSVIPLTTNLGLNESQVARGKINIDGNIVAANEENYANINGSDVIPYLCCDQMNSSSISANTILNALMANDPQPAAILLYSQQGTCCGLAGEDLVYDAFLTMTSSNDASQVLTATNTSDGITHASINGNVTSASQDSNDSQGSGNNSLVAMGVLYSITGLITLLFLVIIVTGAVRARRYPERYGPRSASGGRPRQSRAKGLARAVLETIPIVKFGDSNPPKQDPNVELGNGGRPSTADENGETPNNGSSQHLSTIPEGRPVSPAHPPAAVPPAETSGSEATAEGAGTDNLPVGTLDTQVLGCSICTDDFTIGEDVRVLPCNHKFHPQCIDPWLVNVSGTCPLCRLDLRPDQSQGETSNTEEAEAPPLGADTEATATAAAVEAQAPHTSRRLSRLFELHRVRHATVEERLEALRRYRTEHQGATESNEDETHTRARLSDRLRDRFHIRTRAAQRSSSVQERSTPTQATNTSRT